MLGLRLPEDIETVTVLGAHSDDIEIGLGGSIAALGRWAPRLHIDWIVFAARAQRRAEALDSAAHFLAPFHSSKVQVFEFDDGYFPYSGSKVKDQFEVLKGELSPDLIFTHHRGDAHQDHQLIAQLTWNTFRDHTIWEYEIPKYDGDLGQPNLYVSLATQDLDFKIQALQRYFSSQRSRSWFDPETFRSLARLRGVECNAPSGYAEAFFGRKSIVAL